MMAIGIKAKKHGLKKVVERRTMLPRALVRNQLLKNNQMYLRGGKHKTKKGDIVVDVLGELASKPTWRVKRR